MTKRSVVTMTCFDLDVHEVDYEEKINSYIEALYSEGFLESNLVPASELPDVVDTLGTDPLIECLKITLKGVEALD